jgi:hypothetical protein
MDDLAKVLVSSPCGNPNLNLSSILRVSSWASGAGAAVMSKDVFATKGKMRWAWVNMAWLLLGVRGWYWGYSSQEYSMQKWWVEGVVAVVPSTWFILLFLKGRTNKGYMAEGLQRYGHQFARFSTNDGNL